MPTSSFYKMFEIKDEKTLDQLELLMSKRHNKYKIKRELVSDDKIFKGEQKVRKMLDKT